MRAKRKDEHSTATHSHTQTHKTHRHTQGTEEKTRRREGGGLATFEGTGIEGKGERGTIRTFTEGQSLPISPHKALHLTALSQAAVSSS